MSHDIVRRTMGAEGVMILIQVPDAGQTSAVDYPSDVHVEFDRRIDRKPRARVVLVRVSLPLSPSTLRALVDRFGPPDAGANDLEEGLSKGAAVWVDEPCAIVATAYRPAASWWTERGGPQLQVETLQSALKSGSPAIANVTSVLERRRARAIPSPTSGPSGVEETPITSPQASPAGTEDGTVVPASSASVVAVVLPRADFPGSAEPPLEAPATVPLADLGGVDDGFPAPAPAPTASASEAPVTVSQTAPVGVDDDSLVRANLPSESQVTSPVAAPVEVGGDSVELASLPSEPPVDLPIAAPVGVEDDSLEPASASLDAPAETPPVNSFDVDRLETVETIATVPTSAAPDAPSTLRAGPAVPSPAPQPIKTWHAPAASPPSAPPVARTIATWHAAAGTLTAPSPSPTPSARPAQSIATWHPRASTMPTPPVVQDSTMSNTLQDRPAGRVSMVPPIYPPTAKWLGIKGQVTVAIVVNADGTIANDPRVVAANPAHRGFEEAAIDAVRKWRFNPAMSGGRPVKSKLTVDVEFE